MSLERLSTLCARIGLCSRSEAVHYARLGLLLVNGVPAKSSGCLIEANSFVTLSDRAQRMQASKVTIMLHKPLHYASCRAPDGVPLARRLLVPDNRAISCKTRHDPRQLSGLDVADILDQDATGLLMFSQDGRIAARIARDLEKEYSIETFGELQSSQLLALKESFPSSNGKVEFQSSKIQKPNEVDTNDAGRPAVSSHLSITVRGQIHSLDIRQRCANAGLKIYSLSRVRIGGLRLGKLQAGKWTVVRNTDKALAVEATN